MNYYELTDFEINKSVAISSGKNVKLIKLDSDDQECAVIVGEKFTVEKKEFDPCNNPADAWPIIVASNISLHAPRFKEGWMAEFTGSYEDVNDGFEVDYFESHNENPLRAAMTVYLMMKDAEKCDG